MSSSHKKHLYLYLNPYQMLYTQHTTHTVMRYLQQQITTIANHTSRIHSVVQIYIHIHTDYAVLMYQSCDRP